MTIPSASVLPLEPRPGAIRYWFSRQGTQPSRYTTDKFAAYLKYAERTCRWRHIAIMICFPLPALALSLFAPIIPLEDPRRGARANASFFVSFFVTFTTVVLGSIVQIRATCGFTRREFSHTDVVLISLLDGLLSAAFAAAVAVLWRFPVPFMVAVLFAPLFISFLTAHVVVLRGRLLSRDSILRGPILAFLPSFALQAFQIVTYAALSAAFARSNEVGQITLVVLFPFVKYGMRQILRRLTQHLTEGGNESAVNGVEIAASLYQSMLMQNTSSPYATALLIAIDIAQSFFAVFVLMPKRLVVASSKIRVRSDQVTRECAHRQNQAPPAWKLKIVSPRVGSHTCVHPSAANLNGLGPSSVVIQTLELLHKAESLMFIEYLEVVLPIVHGAFLCVASQLQSAEYSPRLRVYRHRSVELHRALANLAIYTALQALSVFILHAVLWRRYRLDTLVLVAFLLERHAWAVQGKLIAWFGLMFQTPVLHYGFDFTFRFDYTQPPLE